jgi:hypothetical protein
MKIYIISIIFIFISVGAFAETLSDEILCNRATIQKGNVTIWDTSNSYRYEFVMTAKKRGLDCGVGKEKIDINTDILEDNELCNKATHQIRDKINWDTSNEHRKEYVKAAKKRGLECGVSKSSSKFSDLDYQTICYEATTLVNNTFIWNNNKLDYVKEAKKRGLDCEVKSEKTDIYSKFKKPNPSTTSSKLIPKKLKPKQEIYKDIFLNPNAYSDWTASQSKDEMTGNETFYIFTDWASPKYPMSFPYAKTKSVIGIGCSKYGIVPYFNFTSKPNITKAETKDGYNEIITRIKFDNTLEDIKLTQKWGSKSLFVYNEKAFIKSLEKTNEVLLELNWYGNSSVYFKYYTDETSQAIKSLKSKCGLK